MVSHFAGSLSGTYERIRQQMIALGLIHCDETGTIAGGKTCGCTMHQMQTIPSYPFTKNVVGSA